MITLQELFNQVGNRAGVADLRNRNSLYHHCYNHDPFKRGSSSLDEYLLKFGLTRHMLNDSRLQLLIDLQHISYAPEAKWMEKTMLLAVEYNLKIIVGMRK